MSVSVLGINLGKNVAASSVSTCLARWFTAVTLVTLASQRRTEFGG